MAEYIDREEVLELKQDYGEGQYSMMLIDPVLVKRLPTADVIERSKIDKAIAEIKELYTEWENSTDDARLESNPFGAVLNIIQRNRGK